MHHHSESEKIKLLVARIKDAYDRGENAMALARQLMGSEENDSVATLLAYDLQSGSYVDAVNSNKQMWKAWCNQLASLIQPLLRDNATILEVGCGECTTLSGVTGQLAGLRQAYGFDISWSRVNAGVRWMSDMGLKGNVFVADLFRIPLADNSVDVVYSSHSLEPNGGREEDAIRECLRVARSYVVLVEPIYELANEAQRQRMRLHGYIRGLREAAARVGVSVLDYRLLDFRTNPMNPSGVLILEKAISNDASPLTNPLWQCPLTGAALRELSDVFINEKLGLIYPVVRGIPMLRVEHAIVASKLR